MKAVLLLLALASTALAQAPAVLSLLSQQVAKTKDAAVQRNILRGMNAGLQGRKNVAVPPEWDALAAQLASSPDPEVRELALSIGVVFGTKEAFAGMRRIAADAQAPVAR